MNVATWGDPHWALLRTIAKAGLQSKSMALLAQHALVLLMMTLPCEPCRMYFSRTMLMLFASKPPGSVAALTELETKSEDESAGTNLVEFLHHLQCIVDAKVAASVGKAQFTPHRSWMRPANRLDISGPSISSLSITTQLALQALVATRAVNARERVLCIAELMSTLAELLQSDRPTFAGYLRAARESLREEASLDVDALLRTLWELARKLEDGLSTDTTLVVWRERLERGLLSLFQWAVSYGPLMPCVSQPRGAARYATARQQEADAKQAVAQVLDDAKDSNAAGADSNTGAGAAGDSNAGAAGAAGAASDAGAAGE